MLKPINKTFLTGLITILPVVLTLYLIYWLGVSAEALLGGMMRWVLPEGMYLPGMGVLAGLVVVFNDRLCHPGHTGTPARGLPERRPYFG